MRNASYRNPLACIKKNSSMRRISIIILMVIIVSKLFGQTENYKQLGFDAFDKENYPLAISFMQKALELNPNDKEINYYLGYYIHYNAYDSRPLKGYDLNYSDTVLYYFNKALELDPNYGDAKYFYTAECGANAMYSLQQKDYENLKHYYKKAFEIGGFPKWSIEYGKLLLSQVENNGILFTHGDFQLNICWYLQFCENYRRDISVIPLVLMNRPFFVKEIKNSELIQPVKLRISDDEIDNMRPYKWKETTIEIPIPNDLITKYKLDTNYMSWTVSPDLKGVREYLSCERAFLLEIVESNNWERPIYWTLGMDNSYLGGLDSCGSYKGLVYNLLPFNISGTEYELDLNSLKELLAKKDNFKDYKSILVTNQPRISGIVLYAYVNSMIQLAKNYKENKQTDKIAYLIDLYETNFKIGLYSEYEDKYLKLIKE
jgi:tetratricopeptide (TPR) repeat protein